MTAPSSTPLLRDLQRELLDACQYDDITMEYYGYKLIWRGWVAAQDTEAIVGKWVGFPLNWRDHRDMPLLVSLAGGRACGSFQSGEYWDPRPTNGGLPFQRLLTVTFAETPEGRNRLANDRQAAKRALQRMVKQQHRGQRALIPMVGLSTAITEHA